jgi:hypothetical protein
MDDQKTNLMMLFLSHHRAWVLRRFKDIFADSTLIQLQSHSPDLFFLGTKVNLNKSDSQRVQFAARQGDQQTNTYTKMLSTIGSLVKYKEEPASDDGVRF